MHDSEGDQKPNSETLDHYVAISEKLRESEARNQRLMSQSHELSRKYGILADELKAAQDKIRKPLSLAQWTAVLEETSQKSDKISRLEAVVEEKKNAVKCLTGEKEALKLQLCKAQRTITAKEQKLADFEAKIVELELVVVEQRQQVENKRTVIADESVNAFRNALKTLADILPMLAPPDPKKRRFFPENRPLIEQIEPVVETVVANSTVVNRIDIPSISLPETRKRRHLQEEFHPQHRYNLRNRHPQPNANNLAIRRGKSLA